MTLTCPFVSSSLPNAHGVTLRFHFCTTFPFFSFLLSFVTQLVHWCMITTYNSAIYTRFLHMIYLFICDFHLKSIYLRTVLLWLLLLFFTDSISWEIPAVHFPFFLFYPPAFFTRPRDPRQSGQSCTYNNNNHRSCRVCAEAEVSSNRAALFSRF